MLVLQIFITMVGVKGVPDFEYDWFYRRAVPGCRLGRFGGKAVRAICLEADSELMVINRLRL
jgi:hypothetical protein